MQVIVHRSCIDLRGCYTPEDNGVRCETLQELLELFDLCAYSVTTVRGSIADVDGLVNIINIVTNQHVNLSSLVLSTCVLVSVSAFWVVSNERQSDWMIILRIG